jgi:hypothetical protein
VPPLSLPPDGSLPRTLTTAALVASWLAAVAAAGWLLFAEQAAPGEAAAPPGRWPADSRLSREPDRPALVLFAHPHCPCARASLEELAWVLARAGGRADAWVVLVLPPGAPAGWERGGLWDLTGARVATDPDGAEARRFGAATSGQVLVYGRDGRLAFRGGITAARGHQGANPGRAAALEALGGGTTVRETPVFGCPLWGEDSPARRDRDG